MRGEICQNATWDEAIQAVESSERIRKFVRRKLGMDEGEDDDAKDNKDESDAELEE
jgi:hypothetical protein